MRISDTELQKVIAMGGISLIPKEGGFDVSPRDGDEELIRQLTHDIIEMEDREDMIMSLKERIAKGEYNPTSEEIADTMIRRAIADRIR